MSHDYADPMRLFETEPMQAASWAALNECLGCGKGFHLRGRRVYILADARMSERYLGGDTYVAEAVEVGGRYPRTINLLAVMPDNTLWQMERVWSGMYGFTRDVYETIEAARIAAGEQI